MPRKTEKSFATHIGTLVPKVAKSSFEKYGFAYSDLVHNWEAVVGAPLSQQCVPKKMVWPRGRHHEQTRSGGTLHLTCLSAFAVDLQHQQAQIIDRINQFYGYQAVSALSFTQARHLFENSEKPTPTPSLSEMEKEQIKERTSAVNDPGLAKALETLGQNIKRSRKSKQT